MEARRSARALTRSRTSTTRATRPSSSTTDQRTARRRSTVRGYLRQQSGYGAAEALLERKWPEKYTPAGHVAWRGRLYGNGAAQHRGGWRWRVYYGGWGTAFYQSLYGPRSGLLESLPLMPEWYLAILVLALVSAAGAIWRPLL